MVSGTVILRIFAAKDLPFGSGVLNIKTDSFVPPQNKQGHLFSKLMGGTINCH